MENPKPENVEKKQTNEDIKKLGSDSHRKFSNKPNISGPPTELPTVQSDLLQTITTQQIAAANVDFVEEGEDEGEEGFHSGTMESGAESKGPDTALQVPEHEQPEDIIGPGYNHKFRPAIVQSWVEKVITNILLDKVYTAEEVKEWTRQIAKEILSSVHLLRFPRYKIIVTVIIAERTKDALTSGYRCLWDSEADCSTSFTFTNETMYCVGTVFGIYCY